MTIIALTSKDEKWDKLAEYAENCPWGAGKALARNMRAEKFGDWERVFAAMDGDEFVGFCTLAKTDCLPDVPYTPFIGFVFVDETRRGARLSQKLIDGVCDYARGLNIHKVYLVSDHVGLYEKYGFEIIDNRPAPWNPDETESVFAKDI